MPLLVTRTHGHAVSLQVVMTGSDNELMMNVAAHLWSIGANVLVTFSYVLV